MVLGNANGKVMKKRTIKQKAQDYVQDKAMDALLRNTIIYNVAWEVRASKELPYSIRIQFHYSLSRARVLHSRSPSQSYISRSRRTRGSTATCSSSARRTIC